MQCQKIWIIAAIVLWFMVGAAAIPVWADDEKQAKATTKYELSENEIMLLPQKGNALARLGAEGQWEKITKERKFTREYYLRMENEGDYAIIVFPGQEQYPLDIVEPIYVNDLLNIYYKALDMANKKKGNVHKIEVEGDDNNGDDDDDTLGQERADKGDASRGVEAPAESADADFVYSNSAALPQQMGSQPARLQKTPGMRAPGAKAPSAVAPGSQASGSKQPASASQRAAKQDVTRVERTAGRLEYRHGNSGKWVPIPSSHILGPNDFIRTNGSGKAIVRLQDNSVIAISPNSEVCIADCQVANRSRVIKVKLNQGQCRAQVAKTIYKNNTFQISTNNGVMAAQGTDFIVEFLEEKGKQISRLFVVNGKVSMSNSKGKKVDVEKGQLGQIENDLPPFLAPLADKIRAKFLGNRDLPENGDAKLRVPFN